MKKFLALFLLLFGLLISAQEIQIKTDSVYTEVEEAAEYPGGINGLRKVISKELDASKIIGRGLIASETTFIVDQEGKLSDFKSTGNVSLAAEMERVLSTMKKRWIPAKINGQPVRTYYRIPMRMNLE